MDDAQFDSIVVVATVVTVVVVVAVVVREFVVASVAVAVAVAVVVVESVHRQWEMMRMMTTLSIVQRKFHSVVFVVVAVVAVVALVVTCFAIVVAAGACMDFGALGYCWSCCSMERWYYCCRCCCYWEMALCSWDQWMSN